MKALFAGAIAALSLHTTAQADDWVGVAINQTSVAGVNRASVSKTGDIARFWYVRVHRPEQIHYDYALSRIEMNCKDRTYRELEATARRSNGEVVETWSATNPKPIPRAAIMSGAAEAICAGRWRGQVPMDSLDNFYRAALVYFE